MLAFRKPSNKVNVYDCCVLLGAPECITVSCVMEPGTVRCHVDGGLPVGDL